VATILHPAHPELQLAVWIRTVNQVYEASGERYQERAQHTEQPGGGVEGLALASPLVA